MQMRTKSQVNKLLSVKILLCALIVLNVCACTNQELRSELHAYVDRIKKRKIEDIEPLPEVKPYETFSYNDSARRSPFAPSVVENSANKLVDTNGIHPDRNRRKEPLEAYPLDGLRMVGTVEKEGKQWALVMDTEGTIHHIMKGSYIGQNDGKVENISDDKVSVTEIIPDPTGGWREKKAFLALKVDGPAQKTGARK